MNYRDTSNRKAKKGLRHLLEVTRGDICLPPCQWVRRVKAKHSSPGSLDLLKSPAVCPILRSSSQYLFNFSSLAKSVLQTGPSHHWDSPCFPLARTWHECSSFSPLRPWVSVNGPFHTENSPYISFKTFYSIIYTFKIIICNCPSCRRLPPYPRCGVCGRLVNVVCWWPQAESRGSRGATVTHDHFAYPSHFPCFLGQEEVNRKPKAYEPFTFRSEV